MNKRQTEKRDRTAPWCLSSDETQGIKRMHAEPEPLTGNNFVFFRVYFVILEQNVSSVERGVKHRQIDILKKSTGMSRYRCELGLPGHRSERDDGSGRVWPLNITSLHPIPCARRRGDESHSL